MTRVIVSYDGTRNDRDALAFGRLFALAGADISLAYVRHAREADPQREATVQQEAEHLLAVGAGHFDVKVEQRVIFSPSTAEGLAALAAELDADVIAFGSSYRTPPGEVALPNTAEQLIDSGTTRSIAVAPAGLRREPIERSIGTVGIIGGDDDPAARATAESLARALGAVVTDDEADLVVIASGGAGQPGRLLLPALAREQLEQARAPVLALTRETTLRFG